MELNSLQQGLNLDVSPWKVQNDTPTFILNMLRASFQGEKDSYQSEPGNIECFEIPTGFKLIGHILGDNDENIVFMTNGIDSEIGIIQDCEYTQLVRNTCLEFNSCNLIKGIYRVRRGCERVIYWTDELNRDRFFNIDKPERFYSEAYNEYLLSDSDDPFTGDIWDCQLFDINVEYTLPCVEAMDVLDSGGNIDHGVYEFIVEILDNSENVLYRTSPTNPVPIWDDFQNSQYDQIDGALNLDVNPVEIGGRPSSKKAIKLQICDLDPSFSFFRVSALRAKTGDGITTDAIRKGDLVPITGECMSYTFTGFNAGNGDTIIDAGELLVPNVVYEKSVAMENVQGRLVRANVEEEFIDYTGFQAAASKIGTRYKVMEVDPKNQAVLGNPKNPNTWFENMSHMGDEVESLAIRYVLKSGRVTDPFHFPGVPLNTYPDDCSHIQDIGNGVIKKYCLRGIISGQHVGINIPTYVGLRIKFFNPDTGMMDEAYRTWTLVITSNAQPFGIFEYFDAWCGDTEPTNISIELEDFTEHGNITAQFEIQVTTEETDAEFTSKIPLPAYSGWDDTVYPEWSEEMAHIIPDEDTYRSMITSVGGIYGDYSVANLERIKKNEALPRRWQIFNTAIKTGEREGRLGYYALRAKYPDLRDCNGDSIWGKDICGNDLVGTPIRYHKMPDRTLEVVSKTGQLIEDVEYCLRGFIDGDVSTGFVTFLAGYKLDGVPTEGLYTLDNSNAEDDRLFFCGDERITDIEIKEIISTSIDGIQISDIILFEQPKSQGSTHEGTVIRLLGFEFFNIEYPSDDVIGHFFVKAKKSDDTDRTVLDKGIACRMRENSKYIGFTYFSTDNNDSKYNWLMTPRTVNGDFISGSHMKVEQLIDTRTAGTDGERIKRAAKEFGANDVHIGYRLREPRSYSTPEEFNHALTGFDKTMYPYAREIVEGKKMANFSNSHRINVNKTTRKLKVKDTGVAYVSVKNSSEVHANLFNTTYVNMHNCPLTLSDDQEIYGGDTFISNFHMTNILTADIDKAVGKIILGAIAVGVAILITIFTYGAGLPTIGVALGILAGSAAVGITAASVAASVEEMRDRRKDFAEMVGSEELNDAAKIRPILDVGKYVFHAETLRDVYVESTVNYSLRHAGDIVETKYFGEITGGGSDVASKGFAYVREKVVEDDPDKEDRSLLRVPIIPETYLYNKDYSRMLCEGLSRPLAFNYDYCSECGNKFPNRIIFSPKSFDNEIFDLFRINRALDFVDISADKGPITGIEYKENKLIVHTTRTTVILKPNPQVMQTSDDTVYLGTGDFLSIPPVELIETDAGYGGMQHKFSQSNSQFGYFWADSVQGRVHSMQAQADELSLKGLQQWFKENLVLTLPSQVDGILTTNTVDSIGVSSTFDPRFHRTILHKRDFQLTESGLAQDLEVIEGKLYVNGTVADFSNEDYFENKSFTISFAHESDAWISWHSYHPNFMFHDTRHFYTVADGKVWKHLHDSNFGQFYGTKYDSVIEYILPSVTSKRLQTVKYFARTQQWDEENGVWIDYPATFDRFMVYNTDQTTGLLNLNLLDQHTNPYGNLDYDANTKNVIQSGRNYQIGQIRDIASGNPVMSTNWDVIKDEYVNGQGYIDKLPINFDLNRSQYNLPYLSDKWAKTRLFFKPAQDLKIKFHLGANTYLDDKEEI